MDGAQFMTHYYYYYYFRPEYIFYDDYLQNIYISMNKPVWVIIVKKG